MKVMKFGGTSVGTPGRMKEVARLVTSTDSKVIVVLSALSGTTNALVEIGRLLSEQNREEAGIKISLLEKHYRDFASALFDTPEPGERAHYIIKEHFEFLNIILRISYSESLNKDILSQGELLSTKLFAELLTSLGVKHTIVPALDFMRTDSLGEPDLSIIRELLLDRLSNDESDVFITQGFITRNAKGEVDNLQRGGSDYTASIIAAVLKADVCEIWTDISGMHNNDPRLVDNTRPVEQLSFDEAAELAYFGAKILHPASIWPARMYNVPVRLLNTMEPEAPGTIIMERASAAGVKAIAAKDNITAIRIRSGRMLLAYGFLRKVFEVFERYRTPIDMITTSEVAVSLTIDSDEFLEQILTELKELGSVEYESGQSIVAVVGDNLGVEPSFKRNIFTALSGIPVRMVSYGGSPNNISILVDGVNKVQTLKALNTGLFSK